jgi:hypothetical protein
MGGPQLEKIRVSELGIEDEVLQVGDSGSMDKQVGWQNSDILIVEGPVIVVRAAREVVSFIGSTRLVHKFKVKFSHFR